MTSKGVFLCASFCVLLSCKPSTTALQEAPPLRPQATEVSLSDALGKLLLHSRAPGSVIVRGQCTTASFINDDVGNVPTGSTASVDEAIAQWKRYVPRLTARRDQDGMWRIVDSTATSDLLKLTIPDLRIEAFDGASAVGGLLAASQVKQFLAEHGIAQASTFGGLAPADTSKMPRSILRIHQKTVGQAFDAVVKQYPGVWIYTECAGDHRELIDIHVLDF